MHHQKHNKNMDKRYKKSIGRKGGGNAAENDGQVFPHESPHLCRHTEKDPEKVQAGKGGTAQQESRGCDQHEGCAHRFPQAGLVPLPKPNGKQRAAAHAESQQNRSQKGHQREG